MGTRGGRTGVPRTNMATISVEGERFGHLTAMIEDGNKWKFRCDCGNVVSLPLRDVIAGDITDCGCGGVKVKRPKSEVHQEGHWSAGSYTLRGLDRLRPDRQVRLELPDGSTMLVMFQRRANGVIYLHNQNFDPKTGIKPFLLEDYGKTWMLYPARVNTYKKLKEQVCPYNEGVLCDKKDCPSCGWYSQYLKGAVKSEEAAERE